MAPMNVTQITRKSQRREGVPAVRLYGGWPVGPDTCPQAGRAATRDASWWNSPGTAHRYHVIAADGGSACCGTMLVLDLSRPMEGIEPILRCMRNGCREKWPS